MRLPARRGPWVRELWICCSFVAAGELAAQGRIEINQARAFAGAVTPGDAPGFPVSINAPGSYVLTSDLDLSLAPDPQQAQGIAIVASFVTLDLNGFAIRSTNQCTGLLDDCTWPTGGAGVRVVGGAPRGIVVKNGTIRGVGGNGVELSSNVGVRIEDLSIRDVGDAAIAGDPSPLAVSGDALRLARTKIGFVGNAAVRIGRAALFTDDRIERGGFVGAYLAGGSLIARSRIANHQSFGLGCTNPPPPDTGDFAVTDSVFVDNGTGSLQFPPGCVHELGLNRCGSDTTCP